jgi:hypothetical protein
MATGKTHPRWLRIQVDAVDLSGDSRQLGQIGSQYEMAPVEGWSDGVKYFTFGQAEHLFSGYQAVFNNTANTGSHTELSGIEEYIISVELGIRAAPALGDPAFLSSFEQINYMMEGTEAVLVSMDGVKSVTDMDHERVWGVVLENATSRSATLTGSSVDNGASSANGALAHLHVTVSSGGTWAFKIQDSANDSDWADLITFSADGSAVAAERGDVAGTVDQYLRAVYTRTSGSVSAWCVIARQ